MPSLDELARSLSQSIDELKQVSIIYNIAINALVYHGEDGAFS